MSLDTVLELGGMDEDLFIDMVDAEWSFRLEASGRMLFGVPEAKFLHQMGEASSRIWVFGWRVWPRRTPLRNRYLFRNTIALLRRKYVPTIWKGWAVVKLALSMLIAGMVGPDRAAQVTSMAIGVVDGLQGRKGRIG